MSTSQQEKDYNQFICKMYKRMNNNELNETFRPMQEKDEEIKRAKQRKKKTQNKDEGVGLTIERVYPDFYIAKREVERRSRKFAKSN